MTSVRLLGDVQIVEGSRRHSPPIGKPMSLLAFLACDGGWVERDRLAFLFWPDADNGRSRANLRALLTRCRKMPFARALAADPDRVRWAVDSDVRAFRRALREEAWEEALALYRGDLLGKHRAGAGEEYASWLELERESLKEGYRHAAARRVACLREGGRPAEALRVLDGLLAIDGLDEDALRQAMELLGEAGRPAEALRRYRAFARRLEGELGLRPTSATLALAHAIERDDAPRFPTGRGGGATADEGAEPPASPPSGGLPSHTEPFIGREAELSELARRLDDEGCRLLTITGVAGAGKTRLALQGARARSARFPGGCHYLPLESLAAREPLVPSIATALGVTPAGDDDALPAVARHFGGARTLLVLDNVEHLAEQAGALTELLERCPRLQLLVTSRERLGLPVEWLLPLEGFPCPPEGAALEQARAFDAVRFFVERARRVRPDFRLDEDALPAVLRVCRAVEGLPLALELAAGWMRAMPPHEVAASLEAGMDLLDGRARGVPARHRSMAAALERSWSLLAPAERETLAQLAVFRAAFTREAAAFVAGATLPLLAALVDKSLVRASRSGRFDLHPLVRQFGLRQLGGTGPAASRTHERHARFFLSAFERAAGEAERGGARAAGEAVMDGYDDALEALDWALDAERPSLACRLAGALTWFWVSRGIVAPARERFERVLAMPSLERNDSLARVLDAAARKALIQGDIATAATLAERGLEVARELGNVVMTCESENMVATVLYVRGEYAAARALLEANLRRARRLRHGKGVAFALIDLGQVARWQGDLDAAESFLRQGLEAERAAKEPALPGRLLAQLGLVGLERGEPADARALVERGVARAREAGPWHGIADTERSLARLALAQGDSDTAIAVLAPGLKAIWEAGYFLFVAETLELVARLAASLGDGVTAARLWGAADAYREPRAIVLPPDEANRRARAAEEARLGLGSEGFDRAYRDGRLLDLGGAVELAGSVLTGPRAP